MIDDEANALRTVSISANLIVNSIPPHEDPNTIPIGFLETINVEDCTQTPNPLGSQCDDLFTFDASEFKDVECQHLGQTFFLQFGLQTTAECSQQVDTIGSIRIFQCTDDPAHRVAIDSPTGARG